MHPFLADADIGQVVFVIVAMVVAFINWVSKVLKEKAEAAERARRVPTPEEAEARRRAWQQQTRPSAPPPMDSPRGGTALDDLLGELRRVRLHGNPRVRSGVDDEAVVPDGLKVAAEVAPRLDDLHGARLRRVLERVRGRETRDATSDDDDSLHPPLRLLLRPSPWLDSTCGAPPVRSTSRTTAASASTISGLSFNEALR